MANKDERLPGSPTGNQSGATLPEEEKTTGKKPTERFPGSPTGNASGAGASDGQKTK